MPNWVQKFAQHKVIPSKNSKRLLKFCQSGEISSHWQRASDQNFPPFLGGGRERKEKSVFGRFQKFLRPRKLKSFNFKIKCSKPIFIIIFHSNKVVKCLNKLTEFEPQISVVRSTRTTTSATKYHSPNPVIVSRHSKNQNWES